MLVRWCTRVTQRPPGAPRCGWGRGGSVPARSWRLSARPHLGCAECSGLSVEGASSPPVWCCSLVLLLKKPLFSMRTVDMENKENGSLDVKNSVENGRPPDPADWAVIDVVNYFRTAGFEEQASAFQEQDVWEVGHLKQSPEVISRKLMANHYC
ncbi:sterile alpha motif domain-containing protein 13 isoform X4 [Meleagris gallopavo]|uniref:sterile alpha motif domain-containing protein 13 isoform X4 n=1 Tax=Meleagris gallopavo TaxID=9103 RepID=UPI000549D453|nr:sterile alpha motif domain-containing protein 13 isoform X4 [Meleagris gallopavo]